MTPSPTRIALAAGCVLAVAASALFVATVLQATGPGSAFNATGSGAPNQPPSGGAANSWPASVWHSVRLPTWHVPVNYSLVVDCASRSEGEEGLDARFTVSETIVIRVAELSGHDTLVLHAGPNLALSKVSLDGEPAAETFYNETDELFFMRFPRTLTGRTVNSIVTLQLQVDSSLDDAMVGFYRSNFTDGGTDYYSMASTDFEPTGARRAFASFDEPAMKAIFSISLVHPASFTALSNMPRIGLPRSVDVNVSRSDFLPTVPMSTYLVAYAIAPRFEARTAVANLSKPVTISVWTRRSTAEQAQYAADTGARIIEFYSAWFDIDYPLPKCDMIAIPNYPAGAMENFGLITYRETALLFDATSSSANQKQRVAAVVAHELAHQWFGNLVTMKWWNDLWLNEGFATFFEYRGVNWVEPSWEMLAQFSVTDRESALELDAMASSHPISQTVQRPEEIGQLFDAISYEKGGSVLRMLESFVDSPGVCPRPLQGSIKPFQRGLRRYLKQHAYSNARTEDLWQAIADECERTDIVPMMLTWTSQKGFPLVNVTTAASGHFEFTQRPLYQLSTSLPSSASSSPLWRIPFQLVGTESPQNGRKIQTIQFDTSTIDVQTNLQQFIANPDAASFYRVSYPPSLMPDLASGNGFLNRAERAALISDMFALAELVEPPLQPQDVLGRLGGWLADERDYLVWTSALHGLGNYLRRVDTSSAFPGMQSFVLMKLQGVLNASTSTHLDTLPRSSVLYYAVWLEDDATMSSLFARFRQLGSGPATAIPIDDRQAVYIAGVKRGGSVAFESMFQRYLAANSPSEKYRCLYALSYSSEHALLRRLLDMTLDPKIIKPQDMRSVIGLVSANVHGRSLTWNWFRENFSGLVETVGAGSAYQVGRLVQAAASRFSSELELDDVSSFFDAHPLPQASRGIAQTLEQIRNNIDWLQRNEANLRKYFAQT